MNLSVLLGSGSPEPNSIDGEGNRLPFVVCLSPTPPNEIVPIAAHYLRSGWLGVAVMTAEARI